MKKQLFVAAMLIAMIALSACGGSTPAPSSGQNQPTATAASQSSNENAAPVEQPTEEPTPEATSQEVTLSDIGAGLGELDSYRATFEAFVEKTEGGQVVTETVQWAEEYVREPAAQRFVMSSPSSGEFQMVRIADSLFIVSEGSCQAMTQMSDPQSLLPFSPSTFLGTLSGRTPVGVETVNGVPAIHFQGDISGLASIYGYTNSSEDLWVAQSGNYAVKYVFTGEGNISTLVGGDDNAPGKIRFEYNVLDANQPIAIEPPEGCSVGGPEDIPLMPDAKDVVSVEGTTFYSSASALADVIAFYRDQMPANGWQEQPGSDVQDSFAVLNFAKEGRTASITVTFDPSSNVSSVIISVQGE